MSSYMDHPEVLHTFQLHAVEERLIEFVLGRGGPQGDATTGVFIQSVREKEENTNC